MAIIKPIEINMNRWVNLDERLPEIDDLPFVTVDCNGIVEAWDDSDWFSELTEQDRLEHTWWMHLTLPEPPC